MQNRWMGSVAALALVLGLLATAYAAQRFHRVQRMVESCCARAEAAAVVAESRRAGAFHSERKPRSVAVPNSPANPCNDYQSYLARVRKNCRHVLDREPGEWLAPQKPPVFHAGGPFTFSADDIPPPASAELKKWRAETGVVRRLPYPYFQAFSVPSDCCATQCCDVYYMHTLLSRQFGLDLPTSFWPFSSNVAAAGQGLLVSLFAGRSAEPLICPVKVENDFVDSLPLLLNYYYRGWIDHVHSWSHETAPGYSVVVPVEKEFSRAGEATVPLRSTLGFAVTWEGFEVKMRVSEEIESFEVTLIDQNGLPHYIVYHAALGGRQGWDVSRLTRQQLARFYLSLDEEANTKYWRGFGSSSAGGPIVKEGRLKVTSRAGGRIALQGMRIYDLTRTMVQRQMAVLRRYNILPIAATYHGGFSAWASFRDGPTLAVQARLQGGGSRPFVCDRTALGIEPAGPCYLSDLQRDFGLRFLLSYLPLTGVKPDCDPAFAPCKLGDGIACYACQTVREAKGVDPRFPAASAHRAHAENFASNLASWLAEPAAFGRSRMLYMHFNLYNSEVFDPPTGRIVQLNEIKRLHPYQEAGLRLLENAMYNLDQRREFHQRLWVCPVSVQLRYKQVQRQLAAHTTVADNCVRIKPWKDEVTAQMVPDADYLTQDLHGQTFYVADAARARLFVADVEITALKRNPPDFTGRPSVTVIDTHTPTVVFDELDLYEQNGRVIPRGASYYFRKQHAYAGDYCCEVQVEQPGGGMVLWNPVFLNSHETGFVRFAYKKSNPRSKVFVGWGPQMQPVFIASEGDLHGAQGWQLPYFEDREYHEAVLDFVDMQGPATGSKVVPRGEVGVFALGLQDAAPGDSVFFDQVQFLAARGVRPECGHGLVIGGRLTPPADYQPVTLEIDGKSRSTVTRRGGWYMFTDVPPGAVAQIVCEKQGVKYYPARGRLIQACRNDLEYHINMTDPRAPSLPRPPGFVGTAVTTELPPACENSAAYRTKYDALYAPHTRRFYAGAGKRKLSYMVEDYINNRGFIDKDRRFENPDRALRILLQGECWTEGEQTTTNLHMNVLLESMLRRRTGVPVEVIVTAASSSSPASWSLPFEKYGSRFQPDVVLLFVNMFNMAHLEPTMLRKLIGWDKEHPPYKMYDFNKQGDLLEYLPDPAYPAFMTAADPSPIAGSVPLPQSYAVVGVQPALVQRSFQLLRAILAEQYLKRMQRNHGVLGLIVGYDKQNAPPYGDLHAPHMLAYDQWLAGVGDVCDSLKICMLDLSPSLMKEDFQNVLLWEHDGHLTPAGNYKFAEALADQVGALPEFRALVRRREKAVAQEK